MPKKQIKIFRSWILSTHRNTRIWQRNITKTWMETNRNPVFNQYIWQYITGKHWARNTRRLLFCCFAHLCSTERGECQIFISSKVIIRIWLCSCLFLVSRWENSSHHWYSYCILWSGIKSATFFTSKRQ